MVGALRHGRHRRHKGGHRGDPAVLLDFGDVLRDHRDGAEAQGQLRDRSKVVLGGVPRGNLGREVDEFGAELLNEFVARDLFDQLRRRALDVSV